jgi:hypothetical protein
MKKQFDSTNSPLSMLIVGAPGSGKTSLVLRCFPNVYILDCDDNLRSAVDFTGVTNFSYDVANKTDDGKLIDDSNRSTKSRYDLMVSRLNAAALDPSIDTIFIDTIGTFSDIIISEVKKQAGLKDDATMRIQDWGDFSYLFKHNIVSLKASGKNLVCSSHIDMDKDEADGKYKQFLYMPGANKRHAPGLFTHCILLYSDIKGVPPNTKTVRMVRAEAESANDFRGLKSPLFKDSPVATRDDFEKQLIALMKK